MNDQIELEKYNCILAKYADGIQGAILTLSMLLAEYEHLRDRRKTLLEEWPDLELTQPTIPAKLVDLLGEILNVTN